MSFLYPAFLVGALAVAIPVVLHLLRREVAPEVPFTAVRLLQRSPVERTHRRRLRDLLLLAARVVALLLLAFAFARPYVQIAAPARLRLVAIDRSYSMGGADRFERARGLARAAIDAAGGGERIALVAFDDRAEVLSEPGGAAEARAALARVRPGFGGTRYPALFEKTAELADGATGHLVIVSDLQLSGWAQPGTSALPAGWEMEVLDAGAAPANLAITAVAVESDRVLASIRNSGPAAATPRVRLELNGRAVAGADVTLPPGATSSAAIPWRPPSSGALAVMVDDPGGLDADNARYVVIGARGTSKALLLTSGGQGGLYVSRALGTSAGEEGALDADVVTGTRLSEMSTEDISAYPVVVLLSTRNLERRAREHVAAHVRRGAGLFVAAAPDVDQSVLATLAGWQPPMSAVEEGGQPLTLAATDPRHPIFRPFGTLAANLGQVRFARWWRVQPEGWTPVARFSSGAPALLERPLGEGRVVLFASDLDRRWNDFPLHPAFVPFVLETVRHAAGTRRQIREYTVASAPPGAGPGPGVFRTADNREVAVNVDPDEGTAGRVTSQAFGERVQKTPAGAGRGREVQARHTEARQNYWQYGLLVMIAALVAESFVGRS
jgi:hypothetical protein